MKAVWGLVGLIGFAACAEPEVRRATDNAIAAQVTNAFAALQPQAFEDGKIWVVAEEHGELHTYSLTPCRANTHICGGSGRVGHVQAGSEHTIVTGAYPSRVFYLSPGGDGYLLWRGSRHPLAWQ